MADRSGNLLLDSLSHPTREALKQLCTPCDLQVFSMIHKAGQSIHGLDFVTAGAVSYMVRLQDGRSAEIDVGGNERVIGCGALIGQATASSDCTVQVAGSSLHLPLVHANSLFQSNAEFRSRILECVQNTHFQVSQLAACNLLHEAEHRLARWLLTVADRCLTPRVAVTQQGLANILGTQRSTVALVAGRLQHRGLLVSTRGYLTIQDRPALESTACECYAVTRRTLATLYR